MYQMNATETYQLTTEDSVKGAPANISPLAVQFSPDGKMLTYLFPDSNGFRQICALAVDQMKDSLITGEAKTSQLFDFNTVSYENLSLQEQLRRERMRLFVNGVSSYDWIGDESGSKRLIIPSNGQIYGYELNKKYPVILYDGSAGDCVDPHVSPNQNFIAFVVDDDLYLYECNESMWDSDNITSIEKEPCASKPIRLTTYAAKGITCGLADYLAQEEMDRYRGFWWSPDSTMIAYTINDESMIPEYQILHQVSYEFVRRHIFDIITIAISKGKSDPEHVENHRYPFAGSMIVISVLC
jgi:dipeptidyl-peptidase-4